MKIRHTLLALTVFLGLALVATVALQIRTEVLEYIEAQRLSASNAAREQLLLGASAVADERSLTYALLLDPNRPAEDRARLEAARRRVDEMRTDLDGRIRTEDGELSDPAGGLAVLRKAWRDLDSLRSEADAALIGSRADAEGYAQRWFHEVTRLIREAESLRLTILQQERPQDPALRSESLLRFYAGLLGESVAQNEALLAQAVTRQASLGTWEVDTAGRNAGRTDLAWHLIREQLSATPLGDAVRGSVRSAEEQFLSSFDPLQQTLLGSLRGRAWSAITPDQWSTVAGQALSRIAEMQRQLLASSRNRLDAELVRAWRSVVFWSLLLLTGSAAVMASTLVVRNRVVLPLEALSSSMLRLAENDLATPLPRVERSDEIGEMSDALRVFKANALRRQRLEQDKQVLHTRLRDAYGQLRKDLEAAAVIQSTILPEASEVGHVRFRGLYRPSSLIAGDTYNVIERRDGTIGFFQLDVAGHGAPAALMSVASHHALSQALLKQVEGMDLSDLARQINGEWSGDLPYFTMILGEIDPQAHRATIIQAGHPSPLLIRGDGSVRLMGDGGFPIGLFPQATYELLSFTFAPRDRLLLYSDGLVDAESPSGEPFSDARLLTLTREHARTPTPLLLDALDAALRDWRQSETLDDDVSVLVLERTPTSLDRRAPGSDRTERAFEDVSASAAGHPRFS